MRPEDRDPAYLWDMIEAARAIVDFTRDLTPEEFLAPGRGGEITRLAVERELEILGEAAHRVSLPFRNEHVEIPWKEKVDYMEIYRIVREQIPELITLLEPLVPPPPGWTSDE